jgi:allophanate hydrolase
VPRQENEILLAVVGAHLTGQPLNHQLTSRKAALVRTTLTAHDYKLYALTDTTPQKPGLIRVPGFTGPGIEVEVWSLSDAAFGSFVAAVPPPLAIGSCHLNDGTVVKGFLVEPYAVTNMPEITQFGGWRNYLSSKH